MGVSRSPGLAPPVVVGAGGRLWRLARAGNGSAVGLIGDGAGRGWLSCRPSLPSLRGVFCGAFCGVSRRLLGVSGIFVGLAASAALAALGVALGLLILGGVVPSSGRVLAVDRLGGWAWFVGFCGRCDGLRGWAWVRVLSSFRGGCDGLVRASCAVWRA